MHLEQFERGGGVGNVGVPVLVFFFQFSFLMSSPFNTIKNRVLYFKKGNGNKKNLKAI